MSRGNLSVQMSKLEDAGVVELERELVGHRPRTTYSLSEQSFERLRTYKQIMSSLLDPLPEWNRRKAT